MRGIGTNVMNVTSAAPKAINKTGEGVERHQESLKQKNVGRKNFETQAACRMRAALFSIAPEL